jgi:hypothetical protein
MKKKRKLNILPILLIILILALILTIILMIPISKKNISGNVILSPIIPSDCSNESIKALWDSIFLESSNNIQIYGNTTHTGRCDDVIAYKINSNGNLYVLFQDYYESVSTIETQLSVIKVNVTQITADRVRNLNFPVEKDLLTENTFMNSTNRTLNFNQADTEIKSIFKIEPSTWKQEFSSPDTRYLFNYTEIISTVKNRSVFSIVIANQSASIINIREVEPLLCAPNWISHNTSCNSSEILYTWYTDSNNCPNPAIPDNTSTICDYNNDSLIGTIEDFTTKTTSSGFNNLSVYVNNILANNTTSLNLKNKIEKVEFKDPTTTYVEFYWDFSTPLDLNTIFVEKQSSSDRGYILVKGLNVNKSITLNNLANTNKICVKDSEINSILNINESCFKQNEHVLSCPESLGKISCQIVEGGNFRVYGLEHSGAIEFIQNITPCIPSWNCSDWFECKNNTQIKKCTDLKRCGISTGKPLTNQSCGINPIQSNCIVSLNCTEWSKCQNSTQIRTCSDINKCQENKTETRECEKPDSTKSIMFISIIAILVILIIIVSLVIILEFAKKNKGKYI